jgi:hypothetical protein
VSDFLATAYTRNGDQHFGWCSAWGDGFAVIGGTRIEGVMFIDARKNTGGGSVPDDTHRPRPGDHGTTTHGAAVPAAGPSRPRPDSSSDMDGQGKSVSGDVPAKNEAADVATATAS